MPATLAVASLKAVLDRFVGSLGGALWAVAVLLAIRHLNHFNSGTVLVIVLAPVALLAAFNPAYRAAPTTAIILLLTPGSINGPLAPAIQRMLGIGLGSLAAFVVALLVLPTGVHGAFAEAAGRALKGMSELASILLRAINNVAEPKTIQDLHDGIRKSIYRAEQAAEEVARERATHLTNGPDPLPMCRSLRRIRNDLAMIGRITAEPLPEWIRAELISPGEVAGSALSRFLAECGNAISHRQSAPSYEECERALAQFESRISNVRRTDRARELPNEDVDRFSGFAFNLEQLNQNLKELVDRIGDLAENSIS